MNNSSLSIGDMASALGGAGLTMISTNIKVSVLLIVLAVILKVGVAFLQKEGVEVAATPLG